MKGPTEIEARFVGLDRTDMERRLAAVGARKVKESFFRQWVLWRDEWNTQDKRWLRVRDDGEAVMLACKANLAETADGTKELELGVGPAEKVLDLLGELGITLRRREEKKRISYELEDIHFDLDFWPKIPMVFEIEAPSEERVRHGAELLGLRWEDAVFMNQQKLHRHFYGIDLRGLSEYLFED